MLTRKRPDNTPGGLASELAQARAAYEAARADVIERGVTRQQEIARLQEELAREQTELNAVIDEAERTR